MRKFFKFIFIGIAALFVIGLLMKSGDEAVHEAANTEMQHIKNQVAEDAVKQYEIAKKNGNTIDAYAAASMVCASYLQAKDEENYAKWKKIEKEEAKQAGMPQ